MCNVLSYDTYTCHTPTSEFLYYFRAEQLASPQLETNTFHRQNGRPQSHRNTFGWFGLPSPNSTSPLESRIGDWHLLLVAFHVCILPPRETLHWILVDDDEYIGRKRDTVCGVGGLKTRRALPPSVTWSWSNSFLVETVPFQYFLFRFSAELWPRGIGDKTHHIGRFGLEIHRKRYWKDNKMIAGDRQSTLWYETRVEITIHKIRTHGTTVTNPNLRKKQTSLFAMKKRATIQTTDINETNTILQCA